MNQTFSKNHRILNKKDFDCLRSGSSLVHSKSFLFVYKPNENLSRLGLSISKKAGNAVVRNTIKRHIREAFRTSEIKDHSFDIHVIWKAKNNPKILGKTLETVLPSLKNEIKEGFNKVLL